MAVKTTVCVTKDPARPAVVDKNTGVAHPSGVCPGQYIRHDSGEGRQVTINGQVYTSWEECLLCGNKIPG